MVGVGAWIGGIVGAVFTTALIDLLMAEGETKKFVKGIASLLVVAVIIAPLPMLINNDFRLTSQDTIQGGGTQTDDINSYLDRVYLHRYKSYELAIQNKLKSQGIDEVTARIDISYSGGEVVITSVRIDTVNMVLSGQAKNIDINKAILDAVASVLGQQAIGKTSIL